MKLTRSFTSFALIFSLSLISFLSLPIQTKAQDAKIALQRGYRTGYSDGYMAGYRDVIDNAEKNYARHSEYTKADRAYNQEYGLVEDYRDGYQQGFEVGYSTGYEKRSFDATLPTELKKRGKINTDVEPITTTTTPTTSQTTESVETKVPETKIPETKVPETKTSENTVSENTPTNTTTNTTTEQPTTETKTTNVSYVPTDNSVVVIPTDTELILELVDELSTETSKEGDKFTAKIVSPIEMDGAIVEGRISKIQKPGRLKRRSEMLLSFDRIVLPEGRWSNFSAILTEVLPVTNDNVKQVTEGTVEGKSSVKGDITKVGASTGAGALIGVVAGGPVGAAVGAAVGAGFGVGAVVVERGKHIHLNKAQQLRIKSTYETQIR
jgi:hypothetical protein